jgi:hypothetical protein
VIEDAGCRRGRGVSGSDSILLAEPLPPLPGWGGAAAAHWHAPVPGVRLGVGVPIRDTALRCTLYAPLNALGAGASESLVLSIKSACLRPWQAAAVAAVSLSFKLLPVRLRPRPGARPGRAVSRHARQ